MEKRATDDPSAFTGRSGGSSRSLSETLDEIEERAESAYEGEGTLRLLPVAGTDVPALVKALRKALMVAKVMPSAAYERITDNFKVDALANDMQADYDTLEQEVTDILNGKA